MLRALDILSAISIKRCVAKSDNQNEMIKDPTSHKLFKDFTNRPLLNTLIPLSTNLPLTDKPGSWFLLAKCLKNTSGKVAF